MQSPLTVEIVHVSPFIVMLMVNDSVKQLLEELAGHEIDVKLLSERAPATEQPVTVETAPW